MIYTIILVCIVGAFSMAFFFIGLMIGKRFNKTVESKPISIIPKTVKEKRNDKRIEEKIQYETELNEVNLYNIEHYNGTAEGQRPLPDRR